MTGADSRGLCWLRHGDDLEEALKSSLERLDTSYIEPGFRWPKITWLVETNHLPVLVDKQGQLTTYQLLTEVNRQAIAYMTSPHIDDIESYQVMSLISYSHICNLWLDQPFPLTCVHAC